MKRILEAFQREDDMIIMERKAIIYAIWDDSPVDVPTEVKPHTVPGIRLYTAKGKAFQSDSSYQMSGNQISV